MPLQQALLLQFKKGKEAATLTVLRADGTSTWTKLHRGIEVHDLAHYAVEQTLGLENAFYGLLAQGYDISAFEAPKAERLEALHPVNLPPESLQVEHLVNLLLAEMQYGEILTDFMEQLGEILRQHDLPPMLILTDERLRDIRRQLFRLSNSWRSTPGDGILELRLE